MTSREYVYRVAAIEKVTDGDTYWLHLDVGFRQMQLTEIRLASYDTPERFRGSEFEKAEAVRATSLAQSWLDGAGTVWVRTEKDPDSFGRWLGHVWADASDAVGDVVYLGEVLREAGLASVWPTRWRDEFDPPG